MRRSVVAGLVGIAVAASVAVIALAVVVSDRAGDAVGDALSSPPTPVQQSTPSPARSTTPAAERPEFLATAAMIQPGRVDHSAVRLADGRVFVVGGREIRGVGLPDVRATVAYASTEIYDPQQDRWTQGPELPMPRFGGDAFLLSDATVLLVGGLEVVDDGAMPTARPLIYDPFSNEFTEAEYEFFLRRDGYIAHRGTVLMVNRAGNLMEYQREERSWVGLPREQRYGQFTDGFSAGARTFVALQYCSVSYGYDPVDTVAIWILDTAGGDDEFVGVIPTPPINPALTWLSDGRLLVHGGADGTSQEFYFQYFERMESLPPMTVEERAEAQAQIVEELTELWPGSSAAVLLVDPFAGTVTSLRDAPRLPADLEAFGLRGGDLLLSRSARTRIWALVGSEVHALEPPLPGLGGYTVTPLGDGTLLLVGGHLLTDSEVASLESASASLSGPPPPFGITGKAIEEAYRAAGLEVPTVGSASGAYVWNPDLPPASDDSQFAESSFADGCRP